MYSRHWDGVYANRPEQLHREWHCDLQRVRDTMKPSLRRALASTVVSECDIADERPFGFGNRATVSDGQPLLVDVGCGGSFMAAGIRDAMVSEGCNRLRLMLTDISSVVIGEED